ncbi:MAG: haloacid dehalogenase [Actinobacteria bacterium]|nr:MAG: haloacid dehalogenase [Actinomycetota bacterium]
MELNEVSEQIRKRLDAKSQAREKGLRSSRQAIRECANSIRATHRAEWELAQELMGAARRSLDDAQAAMEPFPDIYYAGFLQDAEKEYAEARSTFALITDGELSTPEELRIGDAPYLNGLAEAIGELRRHILDIMRRGNLERGEQLLGAMDDIYYVLVSMDYPDAMTGGLRRTTDVARSIMERTRGDLSLTLVQRGLTDTIAAHRSRLDSES